MREKINNYLLDKMWKKSLIVFLIVFFLIFIGGIASITYLSNVVNDNHIHSEVINITNKTDNSTSVNDYFIVKTADNKTYIIDEKDSRKMFNVMTVGKKYKVVVADPSSEDINEFSHILQVYNVTN